jgi:hypothetical protein
MSEEQSGFKVTDRRLFNADGTPRDIEREEPPATTAPETTETNQPAPPSDAPAAASAPEEKRLTPETARPAQSAAESAPATSRQEELPEEIYDEGDIPGAHDPASFVNFLMSIASNAAAALGMMEHPVTGQRGVDLPLGKHWIDVLGMLEEKTRGNLSPHEQQIFEGLLSDLRLQFVSLSRTSAPKRPAGFTASDILGGK